MPKDVPLPVRHVIKFLDAKYGPHIDMSDVHSGDENFRSQKFRSRALTAMAIELLTGCDEDEAAAGVIDSFTDQGIDGIAVSLSRKSIWVIQTKWSDQAKASLGQGEALKLIRGIRKLQDNEYDDFGENLERVQDALDEAINTGGVGINIVVCCLGNQPLGEVVESDLSKFVDEQNEIVPTAKLLRITFDDVYEAVKKGATDPAVNLQTSLQQWGSLTDPHQAYYGCVSAAEVADWYGQNGEALFRKNIRGSLGLSRVNQEIRSTLRDAPDSFWYLNNGITVLCGQLNKTLKGSGKTVGNFELVDASVVNGAQTVRSIYEVGKENPDAVDSAYVWVRLISLANCPPDFAEQVTAATNTQNQVIARDFVSLDKVQIDLRADFAMSLGKEYVIKRGEHAPETDKGCSVEELTEALACAHQDPAFAARANQRDVLWERGENGTYDVLFSRNPGAERAWRLVGFRREVVTKLRAEEIHRAGRAVRVATQAANLVTHVLLRLNTLRGGGSDVAAEDRDSLLDLTGPIIDFMTVKIDEWYGEHCLVSLVFGDAARCTDLAGATMAFLESGSAGPELPSHYTSTGAQARRTRRPNVVTILVDQNALADGTPLTFAPQSAREKVAFTPWITEDPRRARATWVNNRGKALLWEADGKRYSPSGLAQSMRQAVGLGSAPIQGPLYWLLDDGRSLVERAALLRDN